MISWLQKTLQKHYKWLFSCLLFVVIISFVFTIGASPGLLSGKEKRQPKNYYGYNLNDASDVKKLFKYASISNLMKTGTESQSSEWVQASALTRPPMLYLADMLQVPAPNEYELADYIKAQSYFKNPSGSFNTLKYQTFLDGLKHNPNVSQNDVPLALREDFRIDKAMDSLKMPGYTNPFEVELLLKQDNIVYEIAYASFKPDLSRLNTNLTDEQYLSLYDKYKAAYKIDEKATLSYLVIPETRYNRSENTPSDKQLLDFYNQNKHLFESAKSFADAQKDVLEKYHEVHAKKFAETIASDLVYELYEKNIKRDSKDYSDLLNKFNLKEKSLGTYARHSLPNDAIISQEDFEMIFALNNSDRFYSDPIHVKKSVVRLLIDNLTPAQLPPIENMKNELLKKHVETEKVELAKTQSEELLTKIKAGLSTQNQSFDSIVANFKLENYAELKFKLDKKPENVPLMLLARAIGLKIGEVGYAPQQEGIMQFVYLKNKYVGKVNDFQSKKDELFTKLSNLNKSQIPSDIINEIVRNGLEK